ncbi:MAG: chemotaxis protein CheW, partial [Nanoarchaeota archaeon]
MVFEQQSIKGSDQGTTKDYKERQLVVFNLGNEEFGVNINEVNSILKMSPITRIPNAQHYVEGVINLRGQIMVVIDLAKKLGLPQKERDKNTRIIVIETSETMVGMIVDHSREVLRISEEQIQPPPVLITQKVKSEYLEGVAIISKKTEKEKEGTLKDETIQKTEIGGEQLTVQKDSRLLILLDLAKILNSEDVETAQMAQNKDLETELPKEEAQQESKKEEGQQQTAQKEKKE